MLTAEQRACLNLIIENQPEPIKQSVVLLDVLDDSMRHIMGGDPLESLRVKAIRQVLANTAISHHDIFINYLKSTNLENFGNSLFNKSADLMMSIFQHCPWTNTENEKTVRVTFKAQHWKIEVDGRTYFDVKIENGSFVVPEWFPHLLHRFTSDGISNIDVHFEGPPDELEDLQDYERRTFVAVKDADYSPTTHIFPNKEVDYKYSTCRGSVCFAAHAKRVGGATVFAKFHRSPTATKRDINELMTMDFF